jgi:chaperonin GroES
VGSERHVASSDEFGFKVRAAGGGRKGRTRRAAWPSAAKRSIFRNALHFLEFPDGDAETMPDDILKREVIVVGDKVLIKPEEETAKTPSGLFLPQGVREKEAVGGGYVVNVGPGYPAVVPPTDAEPWSRGSQSSEMKYVPLQARKGDFAVYLRNAAVDVEFDEMGYVIISHANILLLIRDKMPV